MDLPVRQTLLITGGAKRIGRSIALAAAARGYDVAIHYRASEKEAASVAAEVRDLGCNAFLVQGDLETPEGAAAVLEKAWDAAGRIDVLVSSASIFHKSHLLDFSLAELEQEIRINAFSPLVMARSFSRKAVSGTIVHLLDSRMNAYDEPHAAYHLSKRMLYDLTRLLALELAPGFRVNAVAPGLILPPPGEQMSYLENHKHENLLNAHGTPEDVAEAVMFLVENIFVTGQVIFVDGGRNLKSSVYG